MMFEPERTGGLGLAPAEVLLEAGLTAVGYLCVRGGDVSTSRWIQSQEEAVATYGCRLCGAVAAA